MYCSHYHHLSIHLLKRTCINYIIYYEHITLFGYVYANNDVSAFQICMAAHIVPLYLITFDQVLKFLTKQYIILTILIGNLIKPLNQLLQ